MLYPFALICATALPSLPVAAQDAGCGPSDALSESRTAPLESHAFVDGRPGGRPLSLLIYWDDLGGSGGVPAIVNELATVGFDALQRMADSGFRMPSGGASCGRDNVVTFHLYETGGNPGGLASGNRLDVYFTAGQRAAGAIVSRARETVVHELFHLVQAEYALDGVWKKWMIEGTATLSQDLFDPAVDNRDRAGRDSCRRQLLALPDRSLTRRNSRFRDGTNDCQASLFWRYLAEQFGADAFQEPAAGAEAIHALFEWLERPAAAWKSQASDRLLATGDFDGDGREELVLGSGTHLGILASNLGNTRLLGVHAHGHELPGGWTPRADDRVHGAADFDGDGADEILVSNDEFFALLGIDPRRGLVAEYGVVAGHGVLDDYRPGPRDQLVAIGDFDGDDRAEAVFRHRGLLGLLDWDGARKLHGDAAIEMERFLEHIGRSSERVRIAGAGDIDGNGQDDLVGLDERGLFVLTLTDGRFRSLHTLDYGSRAGGDGWLLAEDDRIVGLGNVDERATGELPTRSDEIVIQSRSHIGLIGRGSDGELVSAPVRWLGGELGGLALDERTVALAVGPVDSDPGDEVVLRRGDTIAAIGLEPDAQRWSLVGRLTFGAPNTPSWFPHEPWQPSPEDYRYALDGGLFDVGRLEAPTPVTVPAVARIDGGNVGAVIVDEPSRRRYLKHVGDGALVVETRDRHGDYLRSLVDALDGFVRERARAIGQDRGLDGVWADLTRLMFAKDLDWSGPQSQALALRDEAPPGVVVDHDWDASTPPVKVVSPPERLRGFSPAWSSRYLWVPPGPRGRELTVTYRNLQAVPRRVRVEALVVRDDTPVRRVPLDTGQVFASETIAVAPGESLGVIVTGGRQTLDYEIAVHAR